MSGDAEKEILKILEKAITREQDAADLYDRGEALAIRPEVRKIFKNLADQERSHEKTLQELYRTMKKRLGLKILRPDETQ